MCGIIGYIGPNTKTVLELLKAAHFNKHRGDDGIGIVYQDKQDKVQAEKMLYSLDELVNKKIDKEKATRTLDIGFIKFKGLDEDKLKRMQSKFYKYAMKISNIESDLLFLHHRKPTYGGRDIKNLHPIEVNKCYYMHNGTAYASDSIKRYIELYDGTVFKTETDTEVLAILYNKLKERYKNNKEEIYDEFTKIFGGSGWGVLIEINGNGEVTIIKDNNRSLYIYEYEDGSTYYTSEPTPYVPENFTGCYAFNYGVISHDCDYAHIDDYTENAKVVHEWYDLKLVNSGISTNTECSICKIKKNVVSAMTCEGYLNYIKRNTYGYMCMECMIENEEPFASTIADDPIKRRESLSKHLIGNKKFEIIEVMNDS